MCCCALQAQEINIDLFPVFLGQLTLLFFFHPRNVFSEVILAVWIKLK